LFRKFSKLMCGGLLTTSLWVGSYQINAQETPRSGADPFDALHRSEGTPPAGPRSFTPGSVEDVQHRRIQDQLRQAGLKVKLGEFPEALRLVATAHNIAQQWQVTFAPDEQSPQKLFAEIRAAAPSELVAQLPQMLPTAAPKGLATQGSMLSDSRPAMPSNSGLPESAESRKELAQQLLKQAQMEIAAGNYDVARKHVEQAQQCDVTFELFELRPEQVLVELARHQPARPDGPSESLEHLAKMSNQPIAPTRAAQPSPVPESPTPAGMKAQAVQMLADARVAMAAGRTAEARQLAFQAQQMDVTWTLFEDQPTHLLADLERQTNTQIIASTAPDKSAVKDAQQSRAAALELLKSARENLSTGKLEIAQQQATQAQGMDVSYGLFDDRPELVLQEVRVLASRQMMKPGQPAPAGTPAAAAPAALASQAQKKEQALALLHAAREAMRSGDLATANARVQEAAGIDVAFGLFEDNPETVREDLNRLIATSQSRGAAPVAAKMPNNRPTANTPVSREALKQQAMQLLAAARADLAAGRVAEAQAKASQATTFDVTYDLFEDSPERLLGDIELAGKHNNGQSVAGMAQPSHTPTSMAGLKERATQLLAAARADLVAGRVADAQLKASQAATFNVTYDLFEDSPERLLSEIELAGKRGSSVAMANPSAFQTAGNSALDLTSPAQPSATAQPAGNRDRMVMNSAGLSAQELYEQGVNHLRDGNREAAYESFLSAYQSGEKLDNYRQQQLQDKLRELAPRRQRVQQASNQVVDGTPGQALADGSSRIDAVTQSQAVKFDRLRTECLNAIFRAEKMREKQPEQAQALLNQTLETVQQSDLGEEQKSSLTAWVKSSRSSIDAYISQQKPVLEMERKNVETKDLIEREIQTRVRVEQELATLVEKFNQLMAQRRYGEASTLAKQAAELAPENPVTVTMTIKSKFAMQNAFNKDVKERKADGFLSALNDVDDAAAINVGDANPMVYAKDWQDIKDRRQKRPADAGRHTEAEMRVRKSLLNPVSLHFNNAPLSEVLKFVADTQGINVMVDETGLTEEAVTSSTPISIAVDGIMLESALNLILNPLNLGYTIENEVLNITSRLRKQGELKTVVYQVADLVVPVSISAPFAQAVPGTGFEDHGTGLQSTPANPMGGPGFAQVGANPLAGINQSIPGVAVDGSRSLGGPAQTNHGFGALTDLITTTVAPDTWMEINGAGSINQHESTLSLVIRQTQRVHQEIADLLDQLRRLQDLQVTIEVRFITVSDQFFEQIGIDFDFNVNDTIGGPRVENDFSPMRPFGSVDPVFGGTGGSTGTNGGTGGTGTGGTGTGTGGTSGNGGNNSSGGGGGMAPFGQSPTLNFQDRDRWPSRTVVGLLNNNQTFSPTLDIPFRQGSFDLAAPTFGGFDPNAGISFGMAILSDIEAFMFVRRLRVTGGPT